MSEHRQLSLNLQGLDCADCANHLEKSLLEMTGIKTAHIDFLNSRIHLEFSENQIAFEQIVKTIKQQGFSATQAGKRQVSLFSIPEIDCADEALPIERHLSKIEGVVSVKVNLLTRQLFVEHTLPISKIRQALADFGFQSKIIERNETAPPPKLSGKKQLLLPTAISGVLLLAGLIIEQSTWPQWIFISLFSLATIPGGYPIFRKGLAEARNLRLGMNFLMSIAVFGAILIQEWSEAAAVVFLFALAQLLESYSIERARNSIQSLMKLAPNIALRKIGRQIEEVKVEAVELNDIIIIRPGDRIPLDGVVIQGSSSVNQATITGESLPVSKKIGDNVFAGTINERGSLEVEVTKLASQSLIARIIHLVEEAQTQKASAQTFVETFARYYTPVVVSLAVALTIVPPLIGLGNFTEWFSRSLVLLVISCPCALVISTPVTIISGLTNAARNGILIKGGAFLETFHQLKAIAFDKTGTLTYGKPDLQKIITLNHYSEEQLLQIAASVEARSEHPLAKAILDHAQLRQIEIKPVTNFEAITGKGVRAEINGETFYVGHHRIFEENGWCEDEVHQYLQRFENQSQTAVMIGNSQAIVGILAISDHLRENVPPAIKALKAAGIRHLTMLTGDNQPTARAIAKQAGLENFQAGLLPEAKLAYIKNLIQDYKKVAMVGDGINDAPALAAASIGISLGTSGTDTALETADIVLMNDDLGKLAFLKTLSRKTVRIIKENISIALLLKVIFAGLAIPGLATLWMAVFADMGASLIVIFNGLRALKIK